jgi:diguanylate cyclase (GGDEF)-like protein
MSSDSVEGARARGTGAAARILVADDDRDILLLLGRVLEHAGYEVVKASSGTEALALMRESAPDLVILDVSMPGADGYTVCRSIQSEGPNAPPVIILTAHTRTSARVTGLDAGAVDCISKPFVADELRARVRAALRTKTTRDTLAMEAARDPLTGLLNRAQLAQRSDELIALARRGERALACLMIDLDSFKGINDVHGHAAGDAALVEVTRRLTEVLRVSDVLFRYGGDEFVALLPETDQEGAVRVAERLLERLREAPVDFTGESGPPHELQIRASVGLATWHPLMADGDALVAAADEALYRAKSAGRDRLELAAQAKAA